MTASAVIFIFGKDFFPLLYIDNAEVTSIAGSLLIIAALFQVADGTQVVGLGALRGIADVKIPTIVTFIAYWVLGLPIGAYLGFYLGFGPQGIWYGLLIGLAVAAVLLYFRFDLLTKRLSRGF